MKWEPYVHGSQMFNAYLTVHSNHSFLHQDYLQNYGKLSILYLNHPLMYCLPNYLQLNKVLLFFVITTTAGLGA